MNRIYILALVLLLTAGELRLYAQTPAKHDTIVPAKGDVDKQLQNIKAKKIKHHSDQQGGDEPAKSDRIDTTLQSKYGNLLNDDPQYNKKYPYLLNALEVPMFLSASWAVDMYVFHEEDSRVGFSSWGNNLRHGWDWDNERFNVTFFGHPYSGALSYNGARTYGFNYYESALFGVEGNLLWIYFGENTHPAYNDFINTTVNGAFLGEILYRLSSNVLDDRTGGLERVLREIAAGIIDPDRGFNRILQGKTFRRTNKEVYQKEPLNISISAGAQHVDYNTANFIGKELTATMFNLQLDYGNPFEVRSRQPFDFFRLRTDLAFEVSSKAVNDVTGYGILFGKNMYLGNMSILLGGFQYYDYWDNNTFELGAIGFGGGVITKLPLSQTNNLYTSAHLAFVPFAGNSTQFGPDVTAVRDYNFGGGFEGKLESTLTLNKYATASFIYYVYAINTYVGQHGDNFIYILKPRVTVQIYRNLNIGFEQYLYFDDRHLRGYPILHSASTEQKLFLLLYLEDKQRKGHYN